jgi:hypothetical protein
MSGRSMDTKKENIVPQLCIQCLLAAILGPDRFCQNFKLFGLHYVAYSENALSDGKKYTLG